MKSRRTFVTLFPRAVNTSLIKDVGSIPLYMHKLNGYDSTLVTHDNDKYTYLQGEAKGLNIHFLGDTNKVGFLDVSVIKYIFNNAKNIDVLNLYHAKIYNYVYGLIYKAIKPSGKIFLKLDLNVENYCKEGQFFTVNSPIKKIIYRLIEKIFFKVVYIVSAETLEGVEILAKREELIGRLLYLPNGVSLPKEIETIKEKKNILITVGRIGTYEKNNELLLEALDGMDIGSWIIKFIGPMTEEFQIKLSRFIEKNPLLKDKVIATGNIENRQQLLHEYNQAKIFCLTSISEGFPLVFPEAISFGNYVISTDLPCAREITKNNTIGKIYADKNELRSTLEDIFQDDSVISTARDSIVEHSLNYRWEHIIDKLNLHINKNY